MRSGIAALALVATACAWGDGVAPASTATTVNTTAPAATTSTSAPPVTAGEKARAAALDTARFFLLALTAGDFAAAGSVAVDPPAEMTDVMSDWWTSLGVTGASFAIVDDEILATSGFITARMTLELEGLGPWEYVTQVPMVGSANWGVAWSEAILHPALEQGDTLIVSREWPARAPILATDGTRLAGDVPIKIIGVVPGEIDDLATLSEELERLAGVDPATVAEEISAPGVQPDWFVPVGSIDLGDYELIEEALNGLDAVLVRDDLRRDRPLGPTAAHIVGTTGPITAEILDDLGNPYDATAVVGRSGLELALEERLAGAPDQSIRRVNRFGRILETLHSAPGRPPETVRTTLDTSLQTAAEAAIAGVEDPVALVVVDVASSEVRAAAIGPSDGFDRAFLGRYPPGSTFKIITASALLDDGIEPDDDVECPGTTEIQGRTFRNAGTRNLGTTTFANSFAQSCNTTFAQLAVDELAAGELGRAAAGFGYGTDYDIAVPSAGGDFPEPPDLAGRSAAAIGQAAVLVSPLHQATIAAAVASGGWRAPVLIEGEGDLERLPLDPDAADALDAFMRLVVTSGTGRNADVSGLAVRGKTGSAEFDTGDGIGTHAWFVGYSGDIAFAVVVEGGGGGGSVAAPIAARFLESIG